MSKPGALLSVCFTSGVIGGLAYTLFTWACGTWGVTNLLGVKIAPSLTPATLFPQLIYGGLWGILYFFTVASARHRRHWVRKGLWSSLIPATYTLFYLLPYQQHHGLAGLDLGMLTPLFIVLSYMVWGGFTGFFTRLLWGR